MMTQFLLQGENPFSLRNQPLGTNNYGIVYSLIVWPFAALFGNTLLIHRVITFLFILLCFFLVFRRVFISNNDVKLAVACGEFVVMTLSARGGLGAFPASVGSFCFLAGIIIPFNRSFNYRGLIVGALMSLIAFYTKPYFVLSFAIVASYLFLVGSKKMALLYSLFFIVIFVMSYVLVRIVFPLYFIDVLVSNIAQANRNLGYLRDQLVELVVEFYPTLILALLLLIVAVLDIKTGAISVKYSLFRAHQSALERPGFSGPLNYFAYAFICSMFAFIEILGPKTGSYMTYSYQLVLPLLFLWLLQEFKPQSRRSLILLPLLLFNLISFCQARFNPILLKQSSKSLYSWNRLYRWVDHSRLILNSPVIVSEMIKRGMWPVDSGQTEYYYTITNYPSISLIGPSYETVINNGQHYLDSLRTSVANKEFDTIIVSERPGIYDFNFIRQYYELVTTFSVDMPQTDRDWSMEIWVPIQP